MTDTPKPRRQRKTKPKKKAKKKATAVAKKPAGCELDDILLPESVLSDGRWFPVRDAQGKYLLSVLLRPVFGNVAYLAKRGELLDTLMASDEYKNAPKAEQDFMRLSVDDRARVNTCFMGVKDVLVGGKPPAWSEDFGYELLKRSPQIKGTCLVAWNDNEAFMPEGRKKN